MGPGRRGCIDVPGLKTGLIALCSGSYITHASVCGVVKPLRRGGPGGHAVKPARQLSCLYIEVVTGPDPEDSGRERDGQFRKCSHLCLCLDEQRLRCAWPFASAPTVDAQPCGLFGLRAWSDIHDEQSFQTPFI